MVSIARNSFTKFWFDVFFETLDIDCGFEDGLHFLKIVSFNTLILNSCEMIIFAFAKSKMVLLLHCMYRMQHASFDLDSALQRALFHANCAHSSEH